MGSKRKFRLIPSFKNQRVEEVVAGRNYPQTQWKSEYQLGYEFC